MHSNWRRLCIQDKGGMELLNMYDNSLRFMEVGHHAVGEWLVPHIEDIALLVSYVFPTGARKRLNLGQNLGFCRGIHQGINACLWLVYSRRSWQGREEMYSIQ
jgi:hypothetical protein